MGVSSVHNGLVTVVRTGGALATAGLEAAAAVAGNGSSATLRLGGDEGLNIWRRMAALVPLLALVAGLLVIDTIQNENRTNELAEVDAALLTDDLPPSAYTDPGFMQFLKTAAQEQEK
jgi:hypothetical protein